MSKFYALSKDSEVGKLYYSFDYGDWKIWQDGHGQITMNETRALKAKGYWQEATIEEFHYDRGEAKKLLFQVVKNCKIAELNACINSVICEKEFRKEFLRMVKPLLEQANSLGLGC